MPVAVAAATAADGLRSVGVLAHLVRELDQRLRAARRADGVNLTELSVLSCVEAGNDAPGCIARAMRLDAARMTRVTGRLVALGYLQREADADDRRRWRIHLTWLGAERLAMGRADVDVALRQVAAGLSTRDQRAPSESREHWPGTHSPLRFSRWPRDPSLQHLELHRPLD